MRSTYWDISNMASGLAGFCGALFAAEFAGAVTLLGALEPRRNRLEAQYFKIYLTFLASILALGASTVFWVGVGGARGVALKSVLAVIPTALTAIGVVTMVQSMTLVVDVLRPRGSEAFRIVTLGLIYLPRALMSLSAVGLAFVVSEARNDVQPNRPLWHLGARMLAVLCLIPLARLVEMLMRYRAEKYPAGHIAGFYDRARRKRAIPAAFAAALTLLGSFYFSVLWVVISDSPDRLPDLFGPTQGLIVLFLVGVAFALLELIYNADTMATIHPRRIGTVPTRIPPHPHAHPHRRGRSHGLSGRPSVHGDGGRG